MSDKPAAPVPDAPAAPTPAADALASTPPPVAPKADAPAKNPWDDPKAAEAEILRLRKENGSDRVNAKATAAEEAKKELTQSIAKALGLVDDDASDPAKLTEKLTASQTAAQQARVELAVFRAATAAKGDPAALLDSTSFLKSLDGIDASDTAAVQAAIEVAIEANPRLGAASGVQAPAPNPAQGSSAAGPGTAAQLTRADVERLASEGKHGEIDKAREDGRLENLLAGK